MKSVVVDDLVLRYGAVEALCGVSFGLDGGEVLGLLGPNGAGKTSVLRVLVGLRRPQSGRAWVLGHDVALQPRAARALVGYVPQVRSADGSLTGRENVEFFARLLGLRGRCRRDRVEEVLGLMGLSSVADALVRDYSGGTVRRLEIACAVVGSPPLLVLDEPTLGLDPQARRAVWTHLDRQRSELGSSVLVTTHDMAQAQQYCDRVAVLRTGRVVAEGTPAQLRAATGPEATLEEAFVALTGTPPVTGGAAAHPARRPGAGRRRG